MAKTNYAYEKKQKEIAKKKKKEDKLLQKASSAANQNDGIKTALLQHDDATTKDEA